LFLLCQRYVVIRLSIAAAKGKETVALVDHKVYTAHRTSYVTPDAEATALEHILLCYVPLQLAS